MSYCEHFLLKLYLLYSSNSKNPFLIEQIWVLERKMEVVEETDWREAIITVSQVRAREEGARTIGVESRDG